MLSAASKMTLIVRVTVMMVLMTECDKVCCRLCKKSFESLKSLTNHIRWHDLPQYNKFQKKQREYCKTRIFTSKNKQKMSQSKLGEKNGMWVGLKIGYAGVHSYIKRRLKKPDKCSNCSKVTFKLDLANISQEYKRELNDWEYLCRKCHMTKDGRILLLGKYEQDYAKGWVTRRQRYGDSGVGKL